MIFFKDYFAHDFYRRDIFDRAQNESTANALAL